MCKNLKPKIRYFNIFKSKNSSFDLFYLAKDNCKIAICIQRNIALSATKEDFSE